MCLDVLNKNKKAINTNMSNIILVNQVLPYSVMKLSIWTMHIKLMGHFRCVCFKFRRNIYLKFRGAEVKLVFHISHFELEFSFENKTPKLHIFCYPRNKNSATSKISILRWNYWFFNDCFVIFSSPVSLITSKAISIVKLNENKVPHRAGKFTLFSPLVFLTILARSLSHCTDIFYISDVQPPFVVAVSDKAHKLGDI